MRDIYFEELLREKLELECQDEDDSYEDDSCEEKNDRFCWDPSWF